VAFPPAARPLSDGKTPQRRVTVKIVLPPSQQLTRFSIEKLRNVDNRDKRRKLVPRYSESMAKSERNSSLANGPTAAAAGRVLALSTTAFTLLFAVWLMFGVLGVPIRTEFKLSTIQFAWLGAIAVLSGSIWRLPLGILADRVGGRGLFVALLLLTSIPTFLLTRATSFGGLMVCAALLGLAGNSFSVGIAWNAAWSEKSRQGFALGVFGAGNVGASVTKLIGPALIAAVPVTAGGIIPGGWRFVPVLYSVMLVLMAAVVWFFGPSPDRRPGSGRPLREMLLPLREVRTWRFGLYYVVVFGAYVALALWLPTYYKTVYHLSLPTAALLTALFIFPASLLRPVGGWLSDRFGPRPVTYAVFGAMLLACIPLALPDGALGFHVGPAVFFALVEVLGIGMGLGKASVYKYIPEYFPRDVGAVGGLVGTLGALGGFFLPLAFGYLETSTHRPESCFWVMLFLVLACLVWLHTVVVGLRRPSARTSSSSVSNAPGARVA
jgi:MFS transporter, NNP family, nitrate/nitrite transporter